MLIGIVQFSVSENVSDNVRQIESYAKKAKEQGCVCVCFPECSLNGYDPEHAKDKAISKKDAVLQELSAIAHSQEIDLLVGFMEKDENKYYITHGIFYANGAIDFYRKTHLGEKEACYFEPGNMLSVFTLTCGLRAGFQVCVETHYPEITQTLSLKGAEVVFAPHAVPRVAGDRKNIWNKFIPAIAYDNRIYVACCNQWDKKRFGGGCMILDPKGELICEHFEEEEALLIADIDRELLDSFRKENSRRSTQYFPKKRIPSLYI